MARRVLVQFHNIVPPKDFGTRIVEPTVWQDDREPRQPVLCLNQESGGCRTDQLQRELTESGCRLMDVHVKYRKPTDRRVPVLNYTYSDEGRGYIHALPTYEDWRGSHIPKHSRFSGASPEEQEAYLLRQYQRWCENLPQQFQTWTENLFRKSWVAGRAFVHDHLICINLIGSLRVNGSHLPLSISRFLDELAGSGSDGGSEIKASIGSE